MTIQQLEIHRRPKPSGLRRATPNTVAAQQYARRYATAARTPVSRLQALQVAKRAASALGLKAAKLALIDALFAFSKAVDWADPDIPPIVWPSNELLARRVGVSISTLKHHLNGIVDAGIVAYSDHPTYQRKGRRDDAGKIVEGYGINLSPIAVRYGELLELADAADHGARLRVQLSYRCTSLRKETEALIVAAREQLGGSLNDGWQELQARLDSIKGTRPMDNSGRQAQAETLETLRGDAETALDELFHQSNLPSAVPKFRPLLTTAELPDSEPCKEQGHHANARSDHSSRAFGQRALEKEPPGNPASWQIQNERNETSDDDVKNISLPLIRAACPHVGDLVPEAFDNWMALCGSGALLCRLASINPQVWQEAQQTLGPDLAITALVVTIERTAAGHVANSGGYLRSLVKRGRSGELYLSRSLFALAKEDASVVNLSN